jgi:hypothetical protein
MMQENRKKGQIIIFKTKDQTTRFPLKTGTYKLPITIKKCFSNKADNILTKIETHGRDRIVVRFSTTYAISAHHH